MHLAGSLRRPSYLLSPWPWRALAYLATTIPIAGLLAVGLLIVVAPVFPVINALRRGTPVEWPIVAFLTLGAVVTVALAPIVSAAVAPIERWRLRIVDPRPLPRPSSVNLAARYTTAAAWREVAYTFLLGAVVPVAYWMLGVLLALDLILIASPWLLNDPDAIAVAFTRIYSIEDAILAAIVGVLLLPVLWYLFGLVATGQATVARWLLGGAADGAALREVARSRARLVNAYESERRRIERDLHDGAQARLTSLMLHLGLARLDVPADSPAAKSLVIAHEQAKGLMVQLRDIVHGIRPQSLTELGLVGAVQELAAQATVPVTVTATTRRSVPELIETTAYYVVAESLSNAARHADPTRAEVALADENGYLVVEVRDDGRGGADPARGTGLTGLADRVAAVNGRLLLSSPLGGPTVVRVELPCRP